jgi:archaellum component FlaF (FlaF/FlaG flagellin family)
MKKLLLAFCFTCTATLCFGQKHLLSYDDIKFLLINNLQKADTFMMAKEYLSTGKNNNTKNRSYKSETGSSHIDVDIRLDGKRLFIEIQTNVLEQYDLIHSSIAQYVSKDAVSADVQTYVVKDLGTIYITVNDTAPYDPLKREYDIHIVSDKHITAYN